MNLRAIACLLLAVALAACSRAAPAPPPSFFAEENPPLLSAWGMVNAAQGTLTLGERVTPYDLNTPLFSDYAHKLRTIWMPPGASAPYNPDVVFDMPVGTVITKTFYYPLPNGASRESGRVAQTGDPARFIVGEGLDLRRVHLIETRLLIHRESGWATITYVWNEDQTDAELRRTGGIERLTLVRDDGREEPFAYVIPNVNQCRGCHATNNTTRVISPIGPKARHLNRDFDYATGRENQLARLVAVGYLRDLTGDAPRDAVWTDASAPLDARARAYLEVNCAHCHNSVGPADTSGLYLDQARPFNVHAGRCKLPVAAGAGTGGHRYDIVPGAPDDSVLMFRVTTDDPGQRMPELGRSVEHTEGVALLREWIASLPGNCD